MRHWQQQSGYPEFAEPAYVHTDIAWLNGAAGEERAAATHEGAAPGIAAGAPAYVGQRPPPGLEDDFLPPLDLDVWDDSLLAECDTSMAQPGMVFGWDTSMSAWPLLAQPLNSHNAIDDFSWPPSWWREPRRRHCKVLFAEHLNELHPEDPACVLYAGNINRLGFRSAELLRRHYEQYGPVVKVLLCNAHKRTTDGPFPQRVRPSRIGFVLMKNREDAVAAIAAGNVQVVSGVPVRIRKFQPRMQEDMCGQQASGDAEARVGARDDTGCRPCRCAWGVDGAVVGSPAASTASPSESLADKEEVSEASSSAES